MCEGLLCLIHYGAAQRNLAVLNVRLWETCLVWATWWRSITPPLVWPWLGIQHQDDHRILASFPILPAHLSWLECTSPNPGMIRRLISKLYILVDQWLPVLMHTSAPDPSSQHKTRVDLIEPLVVAGSLVLCGCSPAQKGENKYYQVDSYLYSSPHNTRKSQGAFPTFEVSKNIMKPRIFIAACVSSLISLCPKWRLNIVFVGY